MNMKHVKLFMTTRLQPQDSRVAEAVEQTRSAIAENGRLITELCALEATVCQERLSGHRQSQSRVGFGPPSS